MPDGGVLRISASKESPAMVASCAPPHLQATARSGAAYYVVEVSDTGSGIPKEHIEEIFEPFFSTKQSRGTGLGLDSVRRFAADHGGWIKVNSQIGKGTVFQLYLGDFSKPRS
jgi:signal transduction histidine kinase